MRLRARIAEELQTRLAMALPEAMATVWDASAVLVMVESVSFKPASGFEGDFNRRASFEGVIRAELKSGQIDDLGCEALIASLLTQPVFLNLPGGDDDVGALDPHSIKARLVLSDWRDAIRDQMVVSALRFNVTGAIYEYSPDPGARCWPFAGWHCAQSD